MRARSKLVIQHCRSIDKTEVRGVQLLLHLRLRLTVTVSILMSQRRSDYKCVPDLLSVPSAYAVIVFVLIVMLMNKVQYRNVVNDQTIWRPTSLVLNLLKWFDFVREDLDSLLFVQMVVVEMQVDSRLYSFIHDPQTVGCKKENAIIILNRRRESDTVSFRNAPT
jgi:hypothetical protein